MVTGTGTGAGTAYPRLLPCGESAVSVEFGDRIDAALNARVMALDDVLRARALPGIIETVPTYRALLVHIDPLVVDYDALCATLLSLARHPVPARRAQRRWRVPVVYGGAFGEDLDLVARHCGLSPEGLIAAHAAALYTVYMVGFLPGFSYLGGLDPRLAVPRRAEPRQRVPASSVSIGGAQTAIGSVEGPSGWHLIGRTPVRAFQRGRAPVFLFAPGDEITFVPTPAEDWAALDAAAAAGAPVAQCTTP